MQKFATTVLISLISSVSTSAICHIGQRIFIKKIAVPHKTAFYIVHARPLPAATSDSNT